MNTQTPQPPTAVKTRTWARPWRFGLLKRRPSLEGRYQRPRSRGAADLPVYLALVVGSVMMLLPFVWMISNSLKTEAETQHVPPSLLPNEPQWQNYPVALEKMDFFNASANTIVITVCCVVGQVLASSLVGFGFAKFRFRGRNLLFAVMLATIMLPPQVTMIPMFILFRELGMVDSLLPLIIPAFVGSPFFVFMFRQFFAQIPEEMMEAIRLDGANSFTIYWRMMLPLSTSVIAIVTIYTFMTTWNAFLEPLIYLNSPEKRTLALALSSFKGQYGVTHANELMAASFVTMLPCLVLFFAAQRYFVQSIAGTGLKG